MRMPAATLNPRSTGLLVLLLTPARPALGQEIVIPHLAAPIVLDGDADDPAWAHVPVLQVTMFEPEFGGVITRATEIRIAHDGEFLYAAGVFHDEGPVRANGLVRDFRSEDDIFNLILDTFHDRRTALWFAVNPGGARLDGAITDDAQGDAWNHIEYDSYWDAGAVIHPWGWSAEMRIPFSSLRFRPVGGRVAVGLIVGRKIARLRERHTFPAIRPGQPLAQFKPSLAATAVLEGVAGTLPRRATPYVLDGASANPTVSGTRWQRVREIGGDVKLGLARNLILDLTVNTDFAQTEVDDQRVNLTRFDLLFPEKRTFFLERSGAFDFGDGSEHRLFHSRRIGLDSAGVPVRIYGGARLVGRLGAWDLGLLSLQTESTGPGSLNNTAVRVRRAVLAGSSYLGAIATGTLRSGGTPTTASGVDGDIRLRGSHYLVWNFAASSDTAGHVGAGAMHARLLVEDRDRQGFAYRVEALRVGERYAPPLGFVQRNGTALRLAASHGRFGRGGWLQERLFALSGSARRRHADGALESAELEIRATGIRRGGGEGSVALHLSREDLATSFRLSPTAEVPAGAYTFVETHLALATSDARTVRGAVELTTGGFYDGNRWTVALRSGWSASRHIDISGQFELSRIRFPDRQAAYDAAVLRIRAGAALDSRLSAGALVQYSSAAKSGGGNARLRYNVREGQDLYVVLTVGARWEASDFGDWAWTRRTFLAKYAHTLHW